MTLREIAHLVVQMASENPQWGYRGSNCALANLGVEAARNTVKRIAVNAAGLHRVLTEYVAYDRRSRTHLALDKDTPSPRPVTPQSVGRLVAIPRVGGLHHRYDGVAA